MLFYLLTIFLLFINFFLIPVWFCGLLFLHCLFILCAALWPTVCFINWFDFKIKPNYWQYLIHFYAICGAAWALLGFRKSCKYPLVHSLWFLSPQGTRGIFFFYFPKTRAVRALKSDGLYCPFLGVARQLGSPGESEAGRALAETSQQHQTIKLNIRTCALSLWKRGLVCVCVCVRDGIKRVRVNMNKTSVRLQNASLCSLLMHYLLNVLKHLKNDLIFLYQHKI